MQDTRTPTTVSAALSFTLSPFILCSRYPLLSVDPHPRPRQVQALDVDQPDSGSLFTSSFWMGLLRPSKSRTLLYTGPFWRPRAPVAGPSSQLYFFGPRGPCHPHRFFKVSMPCFSNEIRLDLLNILIFFVLRLDGIVVNKRNVLTNYSVGAFVLKIRFYFVFLFFFGFLWCIFFNSSRKNLIGNR